MGLTNMDISNASLLDEATSCAEAVMMSYNVHKGKRTKYFVSENSFPQNIDVIRTRCHALAVELVVGDPAKFDWSKSNEFCGMLV